MRRLYVLFLMSYGLAAQTVSGQGVPHGQAKSGPAFEVASVRPAAPLSAGTLASGQMHLGMKIDGARAEFGRMSLRALIELAYRLKSDQLSGPAWMSADRWDIVAKLPEDVSKNQAPEMLQALLAERFKLALHPENTEHAVFALIVGKNGLKLKEAPPEDAAPAGSAPSTGNASDGIAIGVGTDQMRMNADPQGKGLVVTGGQNGPTRISMTPQGTMRMEASKMTLAGLADVLTDLMHHPVVDMTGLPASYQITLEFSTDDLQRSVRMIAGMVAPEPATGGNTAESPADAAADPSGPTLFNAVQQLGLKLESRKEPITVLVIDHLERTPTEN